MASEETKLTAEAAEKTENAVTENNQTSQAASETHDAGKASDSAENAAAKSANAENQVGGENATSEVNQEIAAQRTNGDKEIASPFETEATAPEIAALGEVHSAEIAAAPETKDETAEETREETAAAAHSAESDASIKTTVAETADDNSTKTKTATSVTAAESATETAEAEHAAKNIVVKKLKPNPKITKTTATGSETAIAATTEAAQTESAAAKPATAPRVRKPAATASAEEESVDFGEILDQYEKEQQEAQAKYREGTVVEGTVVGISERGVMIDFGYKAEGVVNQAEFMKGGEMTVNVGDTTEVVVKRLDTPEGLAELSHAEAVKIRAWEKLELASQTGEPVKGVVIDKTKGGLTVDINGIEAFLPGSLIESRPPRSLDAYKNQEIEARVIKFSRKRGNIVLSRKALLDEISQAQKAETMANIAEGYIVEGKIKSLTEYGAFVDLGGIDGLLHVTDMSWGKLDKPSDLFKAGDEVQVKVLKVDRERERVSLGLKQLQPNPWQSVEERYQIGSRHRGKVTSTTDYGAFVELEPGVEGLVHVSEMTWSKRAKHPNKIVKPGDVIDVQVLRIDQKDRRVSLGMRQVMPNPWETIRERYPIGSRVKGRVRNMTDFGAFIELEEGVDGLVHLSDISHSKKIKHPSEVLKKNQEVEAIVTGINTEGRRMSLSMKDLQPSAWDDFVSKHKPGDVVRGRISRFANFGVFVELGEDLEGLCHISELSDERIEKPEKVFEIGQELDFKILRIEPDVQKIGLSHRAVGKDDEPVADTKTYSTEAKSGMASLAELANLRNFGSTTETGDGGGENNQN
jgi:small subunit ribosomal protein S1